MFENVHEKALCVVLNYYISSYRDVLGKVSKPTLYVARIKAIAIEAYICYVDENPPYINAMFDSVDKPYNLRGAPLAEQPKVNTHSGLNTFTYQAAKIWNSLPSQLKEAFSLFDFKQRILKWPGHVCQCGCCVLCHSYDVWFIYTWDFYFFYKYILLIADESSRIFYMCVLHVSSHFQLYHTHR